MNLRDISIDEKRPGSCPVFPFFMQMAREASFRSPGGRFPRGLPSPGGTPEQMEIAAPRGELRAEKEVLEALESGPPRPYGKPESMEIAGRIASSPGVFDPDRKNLFSQCRWMIGERAPITLRDIRINRNRRPQCSLLRLFAETASEAGFPHSGGRFSGERSGAGFKARRTMCDRFPMPSGTSE